MRNVAPISAIVTAYRRTGQTLETIRRIRECEPAASEILVHVDGNQADCASAIEEEFPSIKVMLSADRVGPGGGRNRLIAAASYECVASFDDDSYPLDRDYFAHVVRCFDAQPEVAVLAARIVHRGEPIDSVMTAAPLPVASFAAGGCIYRRSDFLATDGYVPLRVAYGMEEVDLALRLIDVGKKVIYVPALRVFHDTTLEHHADPEITAYSIANLALLAFLRYPIAYWPLGCAQVLRRILWLLQNARWRGVLDGLIAIPAHLAWHRRYRAVVSAGTVRTARRLRRRSRPITD